MRQAGETGEEAKPLEGKRAALGTRQRAVAALRNATPQARG